MDRNQRIEVASDTKRLLDDCQYVAKDSESGKDMLVTIKDVLDDSVVRTVLHLADEELEVPEFAVSESINVSMTNETTLQCMKRLHENGSYGKVAVLNFASAKNPGGGLHRGSWEQEENLAAATGILSCLSSEQVQPFYEFHKAMSMSKQPGKGKGPMLFTSTMVYSPDVPVFRDSDMTLLARPYTCSFISSCCVNYNTGIFNKKASSSDYDAENRAISIMNSRTLRVLEVAIHHGIDTLILGPWGCGINKNSPREVAKAFSGALLHPKIEGRFKNVVFAVPQDTSSKVYLEFAKEFMSSSKF
eukprot:scaffold23911_cov127-Cylindrotheca_fusiformis.AAC.1